MAAPNQFPLGDYIPALQKLGVPAGQSLLFARGKTDSMTSAALQTLRDSDLSFLESVGGVRRQNFLWQWGAITRNEELRDRIGAQRMDHVPTTSEITRGRFKRARGYQQNVDVLTRNIRTGVMEFTPMAVTGDSLLSHGDAIAAAVANLRAMTTDVHRKADEGTMEFVIMGAGVYIGTIERLPELPEDDDEL